MPRSRSYPPVTARRDAEVKVRLAPFELDALKRRAELARRTTSDYARLVLLGELGGFSTDAEHREATAA